MKSLNNTPWENLTSACGLGDKELPLKIKKIQKKYSKELLYEIMYEYLYHQQTLYQSTFATVPYLVEIAETIDDCEAKCEIFIALSIIESEDDLNVDYRSSDTDRTNYICRRFFKEIQIIPALQAKKICADYIKSLKAWAKMIPNVISCIKSSKDDLRKIETLAAIAIAEDNKAIGRLFMRWYDITKFEYQCQCSNCENDHIILFRNKKLIVYRNDFDFKKDINQIMISPQKNNNSIRNKENENSDQLKWLNYEFNLLNSYINLLNIKSLKWQLPYLFGIYNCPNCDNEVIVFEGIINIL